MSDLLISIEQSASDPSTGSTRTDAEEEPRPFQHSDNLEAFSMSEEMRPHLLSTSDELSLAPGRSDSNVSTLRHIAVPQSELMGTITLDKTQVCRCDL